MYTGHYKNNEEDYLKEIVLNYIPSEPSGVNSRDISKNLNICSRDVRLIIQKLRDDGHPICATPHEGYWMARTSFDMDETIKKLESHINNCKGTLCALKSSQERLKASEGI